MKLHSRFGRLAAATTFLAFPTSLSAATLSGSVNTAPGSVTNLTTGGTTNWAIWNYSSTTTLASVSPSNTRAGAPGSAAIPGFISDITAATTGNVRGGTNGTMTFNYSNGNPAVATSGSSPIGLVFDTDLDTPNQGVKLSVTGAPLASYRVDVWATGYDGTGRMTASLANATTLTLDSQAYAFSKDPTLFSFIFTPDSASDTLNLSYTLLTNGTATNISHVGIQAVTVTLIPEPSSAMAMIGGLAMLGFVRRRRA